MKARGIGLAFTRARAIEVGVAALLLSACGVDERTFPSEMSPLETVDEGAMQASDSGSADNAAVTGAEGSGEPCAPGGDCSSADVPIVPPAGCDGGACEEVPPSDLCGDLPLPPSVTPLRPMRGAYTGSLHAPASAATLRPALVWSASDAPCGPLTYQVMMDDSCAAGALHDCTFPSPEVDARVEQPSFQPETALPVASTAPVGALYSWRVRACDAGERCSSWSSVAYLHVGRTREDLNGDGYADAVVVSPSGGYDVYLGSSNFDASPDVQLNTSGGSARHVGDLNADGYADLSGIFTADVDCGIFNGTPGAIYGGPDVSALQRQLLCAMFGTGSVSFLLGAVGDLNGDGYEDLPVLRDHIPARLQIALGGAQVASTPSLDLEVTVPTADGSDVISYPYSGDIPFDGNGDFDGNGFADVVITGANRDNGASRTRVLLGSSELPRAFASTFDSPACSGGFTVRLGDANADHLDDWAVLCGDGQVGLLLGSGQAPTALSTTITAQPSLVSLSRLLDFDNDGSGELFLFGTGLPFVWRGGNTSPEEQRVVLGSGRVSNADHNGDGRDDLIVDRSWMASGASLNLTPIPLAPSVP